MPVSTTTIVPAGALSVEIAFGYAHWAQYKITLLDQAQQLLAVIGEGANTDTIPDVFPVAQSAALLDGHFISFLAVVATYTPGQQQPYSTTLTIKLVKDGKKNMSKKPIEVSITFKDDNTFEMADPWAKKDPKKLIFKK